MTFKFNNQNNEKKIQPPLYDIVIQPNLFNDEQIKDIIKYGDSLNPTQAQVGDGKNGVVDHYARRCGVSWFMPDEMPKELIDYMSQNINSINKQHYEFDIVGTEAYQYTVYEESNAGEYKWHIDTARIDDNVRKLSMSILLSDPSEFEGGKLLLNYQGNIIVAEERKGRAIYFPSWTPHCVTPVIKGIRKSLVIWSHGPKFK